MNIEPVLCKYFSAKVLGFWLMALFSSAAVPQAAGSGSISTAILQSDTSAYHLETWPINAVTENKKQRLLGRLGASDSTGYDALSAYIQVRSARFGGWDDSSGMVVGSQLGQYPQLYRIGSPGADRRQLTFFSKRMAGFYPNPDPKKKNMIYSQDEGGNEDFSLSLFNLTTGHSRNLNCPPGRVDDLTWNDSGTAFAYSHTPKGTDKWDIRIGRPSGEDQLVLSLAGTWSPMDFSPDGKYLLVQKYVSATEAEVQILCLLDGTLIPLLPLQPLLPPQPPAFIDNAFFIPSQIKKVTAGSLPWAVVFTSDQAGEFIRCYLAEPGSNQKTPNPDAPRALSPPAAFDVEWVHVNRDRNLLVYSLNVEGLSRLYSLDLSQNSKTQTPKLLRNIPNGIIDGVHFRVTPGRTREFAFTLASATFPGDAFIYNMDHGQAIRWTFSETGGLPPESFRSPQLIHYPTFDSITTQTKDSPPSRVPRQIPAWVYLPEPKAIAAPASVPVALPVLILIHGGPEAQARPGFDPFVQYATGQLSLAIIQPNVRGSSGYGKSMLKADDGPLRMQSVQDIGSLLDWIRTQPDLDSNRVAVAGRSYGGFMALSALIEYGANGKNLSSEAGRAKNTLHLRAAISTVGITHFPSFLKNTSGYRRDLRRVEYGDERDPRMARYLDSISPLTRLKDIASPLLLCHGRNDPRVPYQESQHIFQGLQSRDIPVWFLTFEDEGHAFRNLDNQTVHYRVMAGFLSQALGLNL
jgi:pimeloyl-ACP methyl ester carboxylesterase